MKNLDIVFQDVKTVLFHKTIQVDTCRFFLFTLWHRTIARIYNVTWYENLYKIILQNIRYIQIKREFFCIRINSNFINFSDENILRCNIDVEVSSVVQRVTKKKMYIIILSQKRKDLGKRKNFKIVFPILISHREEQHLYKC